MQSCKELPELLVYFVGCSFFMAPLFLFVLAFSRQAITKKISAISWIPLRDPDGTRVSIPDFVQNLILFAPFGFCAFLALASEKKRRIWLILATAAGLSFSCEIIQLFTLDRTTSATDLLSNTSGAVLGGYGAWIASIYAPKILSYPLLQKHLRLATLYPLAICCAVIILGAWQPYDFSLDVGKTWGKFKFLLKNPLVFSLPAMRG